MKTAIMAVALMMMVGVVTARESRTEVTTAATPADDAKLNSTNVPDVYPIEGKFERILVLRCKYQTDLLASLESMMKQQKIRNAVILAGIGSLRSYHFHVISNRTFPTKNIHVEDPEAPADLVSMNGYVIDGRVHAHMTLANADKAFGGHLEPGTIVFTYAIVTVGVLDDGVSFRRLDDKSYR